MFKFRKILYNRQKCSNKTASIRSYSDDKPMIFVIQAASIIYCVRRSVAITYPFGLYCNNKAFKRDTLTYQLRIRFILPVISGPGFVFQSHKPYQNHTMFDGLRPGGGGWGDGFHTPFNSPENW